MWNSFPKILTSIVSHRGGGLEISKHVFHGQIVFNKSENKDKCLGEKSLVDRYGTLHFAGQTHDKC